MTKRSILRRKKKIEEKNEQTSELKEKKCIPCEGGIPALTEVEIQQYEKELKPGWEVIKNKKIQKIFNLINYKHTIDFVNRIASVAEQEGHHPILHVYYSRLEIEIFTFAIDGLSINDFILASKIDNVYLVK